MSETNRPNKLAEAINDRVGENKDLWKAMQDALMRNYTKPSLAGLELHSRTYKTGPVDIGLNKNHPGSPVDLLATFCERLYGTAPFFSTKWSPEGWQCMIRLNKTYGRMFKGKETELMTKEAVATSTCKRLISPSTEKLIFSGDKLGDPYSDKEVVVLDLERWERTRKTPFERLTSVNSATAIFSATEPQVLVSSEGHEHSKIEMKSPIRRSSDSHLSKLFIDMSASSSDGPSNFAKKHQRAVTSDGAQHPPLSTESGGPLVDD